MHTLHRREKEQRKFYLELTLLRITHASIALQCIAQHILLGIMRACAALTSRVGDLSAPDFLDCDIAICGRREDGGRRKGNFLCKCAGCNVVTIQESCGLIDHSGAGEYPGNPDSHIVVWVGGLNGINELHSTEQMSSLATDNLTAVSIQGVSCNNEPQPEHALGQYQ